MKTGAGPLPIMPRILRRDLAATYTGMSTTSFDTEMRTAPDAPAPVQITPGIKGWDRHDLDAWIDARKEAASRPENPWDRKPKS